jgi:hypothetical protein
MHSGHTSASKRDIVIRNAPIALHWRPWQQTAPNTTTAHVSNLYAQNEACELSDWTPIACKAARAAALPDQNNKHRTQDCQITETNRKSSGASQLSSRAAQWQCQIEDGSHHSTPPQPRTMADAAPSRPTSLPPPSSSSSMSVEVPHLEPRYQLLFDRGTRMVRNKQFAKAGTVLGMLLETW